MTSKLSVRRITLLSILVAIEIILSRFLSIHTWNLKIGFSFVPVVIAAMLFGAIEAGLVAAMGDIIGAMLFPVGAFFPGFTVTAFLTGVAYAVFLKRNAGIIQIVTAVLVVQFGLGLCVNTFWISFLYGSPYWPLFFTRIYQATGMTVIQTAVIMVISRSVVPSLIREI